MEREPMEKSVSSNSDTANFRSTNLSHLADDEKDRGSRLDQWVGKRLLSILGNPPIALVVKDRTVIKTCSGRPKNHVIIHDRPALILLLINPEYFFGALYSVGRVEVDGDLVDFLCLVNRALYGKKNGLFAETVNAWIKRLTIHNNNLHAARRNIHHHYDIGNAFYEKWLDTEMQYTCAYYADPSYTLEQAQLAKMHHVCRKLRLQPGQTVVEAGCGWGGLALLMAREYGVNVKAYNISREQIAYARRRAQDEGLHGRVEFIEDDYRNIRGEYDVFASVGMLEHIGINNYKGLGRIIDSCLKETGIGLIHTIGRNSPDYLNTWIESRIFPGARPPSISQMMNIFEPQKFSILDIENIRLHYAKTLEQWLLRFNNHIDEIRSDYDEEFIRSWRLYLSGSIASFYTGNMQLFQVVFTRSTNNALPWSRSYLYSQNMSDKEHNNGKL